MSRIVEVVFSDGSAWTTHFPKGWDKVDADLSLRKAYVKAPLLHLQAASPNKFEGAELKLDGAKEAEEAKRLEWTGSTLKAKAVAAIR